MTAQVVAITQVSALSQILSHRDVGFDDNAKIEALQVANLTCPSVTTSDCIWYASATDPSGRQVASGEVASQFVFRHCPVCCTCTEMMSPST